MHYPQLTGAALLVQQQQLVETAHAMNQHRFSDLFRHLYLSHKSGFLREHIAASQRIQSTLPYRPDIRQQRIFAQLSHLVRPVGSYIPRMQPHGTSLHVSTYLTRIAVEHKCLGRVFGNKVCVNIEHGDYQWNCSGTGS